MHTSVACWCYKQHVVRKMAVHLLPSLILLSQACMQAAPILLLWLLLHGFFSVFWLWSYSSLQALTCTLAAVMQR
jgi:hypothetical protein